MAVKPDSTNEDSLGSNPGVGRTKMQLAPTTRLDRCLNGFINRGPLYYCTLQASKRFLQMCQANCIKCQHQCLYSILTLVSHKEVLLLNYSDTDVKNGRSEYNHIEFRHQSEVIFKQIYVYYYITLSGHRSTGKWQYKYSPSMMPFEAILQSNTVLSNIVSLTL